MRTSLKVAAGLLANFAMFSNSVLAYLPPIDFENYGNPGTPVNLSSPDAWQPILGLSEVSSAGSGFGGTGKALRILADSNEEAWLRKPISWNAADTIAFIDFRIKPAATPAGSQANFFANGTQLAFQLPAGSTDGELWVLHGNDDDPDEVPAPEKWYQTAGEFTVPTGSPVSSDWVRATLRHDYGRKVWDLFINDKLAAVNLGFEGRGENLTDLEFFGSQAGDVLIDNLEANPENMLFADADKDGLPDDWEIANGSNPNLYDRESIKPGTGKSFLDHYLDSLWNVSNPGQPVNGANDTGNVGTVPPLSILAYHQPVGALKGQFAVGGDGAATYTMPLDVPKGRAGMEPQLSLNYSSNGGNGTMGVGWSLGGLQKITRGPATTKEDKISDAADFDADDRFYLDGERLVCVSGTYGKSGSEYRTELDSYARITAVGEANLAPTYWTVETKAGLKVTLGGNPDSRVQIGTEGILSWLVSQVADTTGRNAYCVDYCDDAEVLAATGASSRYPWKVRYTVDPTLTSDVGFCSMIFDYESRPDVNSGYIRGAEHKSTRRLARIDVKTGSFLNHAYIFDYFTSRQTGRSLLTSVGKVASDGSLITPTTFQWETLSHTDEKWKEAEGIKFNEYGSGEDSGSDMASFVSVSDTDPTEIHLTGNAWRTYEIPYNVTANTRMQFEYRTTVVAPKWGMIGLDENALTGSPKRLFKLVGGAFPPVSTYNDNSWEYTKTDGSPQTITINVGQYYTGPMIYLALVNDDNTANDGVGESWFKGIRIYEHPQTPADVSPIVFDQAIAAPRIIGGNNEDLGVRIQDLNGDGLPDIAYNLLYGKSTTNNAPVSLYTFGQVLRNTGSGFVHDSDLKLPSTVPTGNLPGAGEGQFANSQAIYPVPVDIDGDGKVDYAYARNLRRESSSTFSCEHGYLTWQNGAWVDKPEYVHKFWSLCNTSEKRFSHFEHMDLDGDGDLDVVIHPYGADLFPYNPAASPARSTSLLLDGNSGSNNGLAYLNEFEKLNGSGQPLGWVAAPEWRLPEQLKIPGFNNSGGEVGRGIQDLNADGRPDIYSNLWPNPDEVWHSEPESTYVSPKTLAVSKWVPQPAVNPNSNPVVPPLTSLPEDITNTSGDDIGTRLVDVNGDGHMDLLKALGSQSMNLNVGVYLNKGGVGWQLVANAHGGPWAPEENFNTVDKRGEMKEQGTSFTDLNADGLADFVVSKYTRNTVFLNTGSTWWPESIEEEDGDDVLNPQFWATGSAQPAETKKWELPFRIYPNTTASTSGIRHAMLVDLDGDGVSDLIGDMKSAVPRVWINQAKPERIIGFTDGFGSNIEVNLYRRLNDPAPVINNLPGTPRRVYDKTPVSALLPGHVSLQDSRWVVARYSQPDGQGGRHYRSHYYRDLRYDKANEVSLGFGKIEIHDELTKGYSSTQNRRDFPFAGSTDIAESFVYVATGLPKHANTIAAGFHYRVSQETASYGELPSTVGSGVPESRLCGTIRRPVQTGSVSRKWDVNGTLLSEVTTTQDLTDYDPYGFVKKSTVKALDGTTTITENNYWEDISAGRWWLGRLSASTVRKRESLNGPDIISKTSSFTYFNVPVGELPATGLLASETAQPGHALFVEKTYVRDAYGNITSTAVRANSKADGEPADRISETRTTTTEWDADYHYRFPTKETNAIGEVKFTYSSNRALLLSSTDLDGRKTTFSYDAFGTKLATNYPDLTRSAEITRFVMNSDLPSGVTAHLGGASIRWARSAQASATPWKTVYFDALGRELVTETVVMTAFDGSSPTFANQYTVSQYDSRGRKFATSTPFLAGETPYWTVVEFDELDRVVKTTRPDLEDEGVTQYDALLLNGKPVSYLKTYNAKDHELERWTDQHGRLIQSSDETGRLTTFNHDLEGRITSVYIGTECQLRNRWDLLGNKVAVWDMSSGGSDPGASFSDPNAALPNPADYHYSVSVPNGFGEVRSTTTPHGIVKTVYDIAGRVSQVERDGKFYDTTYNLAAPGKGKPARVDGTGGYQEVFTYGSNLGEPYEYGKLTSTSKRQSSAEAAFVSRTKYNAVGLVMDEYFDGVAGTDDDAHVRHEYESVYGSYQIRTKLIGYGSTGTVLSEFGSVVRSGAEIVSIEKLSHDVTRETRTDARTGNINKIVSTRLGGTQTLQDLGYTWDANSNLVSRTDGKTGKTESFSSDNLDRLTSSTVSGQSTVLYNYDDDNRGNLVGKGGSSLTYSGYRVTSATIKGQVRNYTYDNAGHVLGDGKRNYEWTSFGQLKAVEQDSCPAMETFAITGTYAPGIPGISSRVIYEESHARAEFDFDAGGSRSKQTLVRSFYDGSAARCITRYLGSYELEEHASQPISGGFTTIRNLHRHQLGNALLTCDDKTAAHPDGASTTVRLAVILNDHIGSTDVIVRADWNGTAWKLASTEPAAERQSFDAWGQRRDGTAWSELHPAYNSTSAMDYDRGFTGHEMLDDFGVVHMNGRIYDAELGRFLSPDPYVQVPEYSQNFNRYSYVLNNPLSNTDPTGNLIELAHHGAQAWLFNENHKVKLDYLQKQPEVGQVVAIVAAFALWWTGVYLIGLSGWGLGGFVGGAGGAVNGAISSGGDPGTILRGAVVGGIQGAISGGILHDLGAGAAATATQPSTLVTGSLVADRALNIVGHAILGGAANAAMGGKFQDGFLSAGVSAALAVSGLFDVMGLEGPGLVRAAGRTAVAGIIGGTASAVGGGKFSNGAWTAAFQHLLNHEAVNLQKAQEKLYLIFHDNENTYGGMGHVALGWYDSGKFMRADAAFGVAPTPGIAGKDLESSMENDRRSIVIELNNFKTAGGAWSIDLVKSHLATARARPDYACSHHVNNALAAGGYPHRSFVYPIPPSLLGTLTYVSPVRVARLYFRAVKEPVTNRVTVVPMPSAGNFISKTHVYDKT